MSSKHPHYFKNVAHLTEIDVYRVLKLFGVTDPCMQHAIKKLLVAGGRGAGKDAYQDVKEAIDSLERWMQMDAEDDNVGDTPIGRDKLRALGSMVHTQTSDPLSGTDPYMRGMANGLLVAQSVFTGEEPELLTAQTRETKRLLSNPANRKRLEESIAQVKSLRAEKARNERISISAEALASVRKRTGCTAKEARDALMVSGGRILDAARHILNKVA